MNTVNIGIICLTIVVLALIGAANRPNRSQQPQQDSQKTKGPTKNQASQ